LGETVGEGETAGAVLGGETLGFGTPEDFAGEAFGLTGRIAAAFGVDPPTDREAALVPGMAAGMAFAGEAALVPGEAALVPGQAALGMMAGGMAAGEAFEGMSCPGHIVCHRALARSS